VLLGAVLLQVPWRAGREVMGFGFAAPMLAALGCLVATIFGSSLTLAVANVIGSPRVAVQDGRLRGETLLVPSTVYAGGLGMVAAVLLTIGVGGYLFTWSRWEATRLARTDERRDDDSVLTTYPEPGGPAAVRSVATTWARSALTDHAATALSVVTLPTGALVLGYLISLEADGNPAVLRKIAQIGGAIGVAATVYFLATLRSAFLHAAKRKRFGFVWDVGTFWPRACHPFGPPCYAERTVPEVVTRLRRMVGHTPEAENDPALGQQDAERRLTTAIDLEPPAPVEAQSPVLLTGYSQGTPISVAVLAQLPAEVRDQMSLLTLAAPVRRLYGRTFPAYFGPDQLARLHEYLTTDGVVRWRNLVRRSDYIGGSAFDRRLRPVDHALVDRLIHDPPVLWADNDPSPPAAHLHSDLFPDPQTRPHAVALAQLLGDRSRPRVGPDPGDRVDQLPAAGGADELSGGTGARHHQ
jgi:hypothetical protein